MAETVKAAGVVWAAIAEGGYAAAGGRFAICRRGSDWCLTDRKTRRERIFHLLKDAKAGADWVLAQPVAG